MRNLGWMMSIIVSMCLKDQAQYKGNRNVVLRGNFSPLLKQKCVANYD